MPLNAVEGVFLIYTLQLYAHAVYRIQLTIVCDCDIKGNSCLISWELCDVDLNLICYKS